MCHGLPYKQRYIHEQTAISSASRVTLRLFISKALRGFALIHERRLPTQLDKVCLRCMQHQQALLAGRLCVGAAGVMIVSKQPHHCQYNSSIDPPAKHSPAVTGLASNHLQPEHTKTMHVKLQTSTPCKAAQPTQPVYTL